MQQGTQLNEFVFLPTTVLNKWQQVREVKITSGLLTVKKE
jgi:hypothetical protein